MPRTKEVQIRAFLEEAGNDTKSPAILHPDDSRRLRLEGLGSVANIGMKLPEAMFADKFGGAIVTVLDHFGKSVGRKKDDPKANQ